MDCSGNQLTNLEPLQACPDLQSLNCGANHLTSLEPLQACPGLSVLYCGGNQLTSLEPLRACAGLWELNCPYNSLTSLEPLHGLKSLKELYCWGNPSLSRPEIERFQKDRPFFRVINSPGLTVSSHIGQLFVQLARRRRPWWLSLDEQWRTIFTTARGASYAALNLALLDCHSKNLTHLEPLRECPCLQAVNCRDNQLTSLEPLYGFKNLRILDCRDNPSLSEAEIERFRKAVPFCGIGWGIGSDSPSEADYSDYIVTDYED